MLVHFRQELDSPPSGSAPSSPTTSRTLGRGELRTPTTSPSRSLTRSLSNSSPSPALKSRYRRSSSSRTPSKALMNFRGGKMVITNVLNLAQKQMQDKDNELGRGYLEPHQVQEVQSIPFCLTLRCGRSWKASSLTTMAFKKSCWMTLCLWCTNTFVSFLACE